MALCLTWQKQESLSAKNPGWQAGDVSPEFDERNKVGQVPLPHSHLEIEKVGPDAPQTPSWY